MGPILSERGDEAVGAAERAVRLVARRNRLLGLWAAARMGLTEAEARSYATQVVQAEFEEAGDDDIVRMIAGDLWKSGIETSLIEVREALARCSTEAARQLETEHADER
ncbi:MAG: DUF1476 domain-containing protein [Sphingomonadaceae bacterium]